MNGSTLNLLQQALLVGLVVSVPLWALFTWDWISTLRRAAADARADAADCRLQLETAHLDLQILRQDADAARVVHMASLRRIDELSLRCNRQAETIQDLRSQLAAVARYLGNTTEA